MKIRPKKNNPCVECVMTEAKSIKINLSMLERLWNKAKKAGQDAVIVMGIRRNDNEIFSLTGKVEVEGQKKIK